MICIETEEIISIAALTKNCNSGHISSVCNGKLKTTGGYHWRYYEVS